VSGPSPDAAAAALRDLAAAFEQAARRSDVTTPEHTAGNGGDSPDLRYRNLVEQIPAVVFTASLAGGGYDLYVGPQIEHLLGYTQKEWLSSPVLWYERLHPDDRRLLDQEFARGCATGGPFRADCRFLARDGHVVWVHGEARLINDARGFPVLLQGVAFDITETKRAEELVRAALREKETLLKEIHHRVKNNLQITSSLLRLQLGTVSDPDARHVLLESQDRIRSMALVHEMLYRSPDLSRVDFAPYVGALLEQLFRAHNVDSDRVAFRTTIPDLVLGVDLAMPLGLIINELVANSLKHGFPGERRGTVDVELRLEHGRYRLSVRDTGVGLGRAGAAGGKPTLGLQLVRMLTGQLGGTIEWRGAGGARDAGGTEAVISFPRAGGA
jgi:PAS domain S-box-containing protein